MPGTCLNVTGETNMITKWVTKAKTDLITWIQTEDKAKAGLLSLMFIIKVLKGGENHPSLSQLKEAVVDKIGYSFRTATLHVCYQAEWLVLKDQVVDFLFSFSSIRKASVLGVSLDTDTIKFISPSKDDYTLD